MDELRRVVGEVAFNEFVGKSHVQQTVCVLSPDKWDQCHRVSVCRLAKEFMCKIWHARMRKVSASLAAPGTSQSGAAPSRGAEVYGQLTTTPNS